VEYAYQIRNSGGGLYHFPALTEQYPRFQGGFVWDWQDKSLLQTNAKGEPFFAYGGDFNESMTDPDIKYMTNNGVVLPDLTWKPVAFELKQAYAPVTIRPAESWEGYSKYNVSHPLYKISNKTLILTMDKFEICLYLRENGYIVHQEIYDPGDVPPQTAKKIEVPISYPMKDNAEYYLEFHINFKEATTYGEAGHTACFFQYPVQTACSLLHGGVETAYNAANLTEKGDCYVLNGLDIELSVNRKDGCFTLRKNDDVYLVSSGRPCIERPYSGMDTHKNWGLHNEYAVLNPSATDTSVENVYASSEGITVIYKLATQKDEKCYESRVENRYRFVQPTNQDTENKILLEVDTFITLNEKLMYVPRVGMELTAPVGFEDLTYYGLGENENYPDRKMSAILGVHESTVSQQHFPFGPSAECGGHEQTRWLTLGDKENQKRIKIVGSRPFHFDAHHNTVGDYQAATHNYKLPIRQETYLHIDVAHSGIGGNMGWSTQLSAKHLVAADVYRLRFVVDITRH